MQETNKFQKKSSSLKIRMEIIIPPSTQVQIINGKNKINWVANASNIYFEHHL